MEKITIQSLFEEAQKGFGGQARKIVQIGDYEVRFECWIHKPRKPDLSIDPDEDISKYIE